MTAERLSILHMTSWYPTATEPVAGTFVREHVKAVARSHDVHVIHLEGYDPQMGRLPWRIRTESDETLTEGLPTLRVRHGSPSSKLVRWVQVLSALDAFRRTRAGGFRPDIVHAHEYQAGYAATFLGRLMRIPVIVTEHSTAFPRRLLPPSDLPMARRAFAGARVVCPVSAYLRDAIQGYGFTGDFRIVPNAVDTDIFIHEPVAPPPPARLLFVGLLSTNDIKGIPHLLRALAKISGTNWVLDLVGDGPARASYERLSRELGLDDRVTFRGLVSKSGVAEFMQQAHLLLLPSLYENLPCVLLEAQAVGVPIVASAVGGIPEIVGPQQGTLVPPADAEALAAAIFEAIENWRRFDREGIAKQAADRFGSAAVGHALDHIYREVL